jgi:Tfp pilus assembly protein PilF
LFWLISERECWIKLNTVNYPESYKAFENLSKAYIASGDSNNAVLNLKKSLELNQENIDIQKLLPVH